MSIHKNIKHKRTFVAQNFHRFRIFPKFAKINLMQYKMGKPQKLSYKIKLIFRQICENFLLYDNILFTTILLQRVSLLLPGKSGVSAGNKGSNRASLSS